MTSYEPLRASAPAPAPMAHHLVKWWRNKFRSGYKKFTIDDSERTDTEELVGRASSQCSAPPDLLPSEARALLQPSTPPPIQFESYKKHSVSCSKGCPQPTETAEDKHSRLRFEELTCDVELQHSESSKQKPLQFSFTLYDLDGRGRMTKDDIAGIVSTIYESIGKSVTVPHYGSKTIQVRLTVVPEESGKRNKRERKEDRNKRKREPPANNIHTPLECADNISDDEQQERSSPDEDASSKSSCSGDQKPMPRQPPVTRHRPQRQRRKDHRERRHEKKRSGSLQRRELLEIIQANMEKNRLSFQTTRKPNESVGSEEIRSKYQKLRNRSITINEKPNNAFQKLKPEMNGYLDLAGTGDSHLCRYDRHLHAVICSSTRHAHIGYHQKQSQPTRHARAPHPANGRSRSHDLPYHLQSSKPRVLQIIFL